MNIFRSITENEAGVLKANLSEPEFDGLRNDPFHFSDTNIKVSRYLVSSSYYVIQLLSKSYLLPITQEASECSSSTCIVPKDDASFFLFHERFPSGQTLYPKSHISFLATQCNVEKPRFLTSSFVKAFPSFPVQSFIGVLFNLQAINDSDLIISLANHGAQEDMKYSQIFWFNTLGLPDSREDHLLLAELRIYKELTANW